MSILLQQCYSALSNPAGYNVNEVSNQLMKVYEEPTTFGVIVALIKDCGDTSIQQHAVVGLGQCIKKHIDAFQRNPDVVNSVFSLCLADNQFVRSNALFYLRILVSDICAAHCLEMVKCINIQDDVQVNAALHVLKIVLPYLTDEQIDLSFLEGMVARGFESQLEDNHVGACCLEVSLVPYVTEGSSVSAILERAVSVYHRALAQGPGESVHRLTIMFEQFIENLPEGADVSGLIVCCLECLSSPDVLMEYKHSAIDIVDTFISNCFYDIAHSENVAKILETYVKFCVQTYDANEEFESSNHDLFEAFSNVFAENEEMLNSIWGMMPGLLSQGSPGRFTTLSLLLCSFESSKDFFAERGSDLCAIFQDTLGDGDLCLRSTAAHCVVAFCETIDYVEMTPVVQALIGGFVPEVATEYLDGLIAIYDKLVNTDPVFDRSYEFLVGLLEFYAHRGGELHIQQKILRCVASLTTHSIERIFFHFDAIFPCIMNVINQGDDSLKPSAVECIAHCCDTCPQQMAQHVPTFLQFLVGHLDTIECVSGFGLVCESFSEAALPFVEQGLQVLLENANKDVDLDNMDDFGDDDDFGVGNGLSVTAASLRVICQVLHVYPQLIPQLFPSLIQLLGRFKNSGSGDETFACSKGSVLICDAVSKDANLSQFLAPMMDLVVSLARNSSDSSTAGSAFQAIAELYESAIPLDPRVIEVVCMALKSEMFFQRMPPKYDESLHGGLSVLLNALLSHDTFIETVTREIVPLVQGMLTLKDKALNIFALNFLANITKRITTETAAKDALLSQALAVGAFECVMCLVESDPTFAAQRMGDIIQGLQRFLETSSSRSNEKMMLLICHLVLSCNMDPTPFIDFLFQTIPPHILIESTNTCVELLLRILQQPNEQWKTRAYACLVSIFGETPAMIQKRRIRPETLAEAKRSVAALIQGLPDARAFCSDCFGGDSLRVSCFERNMGGQ